MHPRFLLTLPLLFVLLAFLAGAAEEGKPPAAHELADLARNVVVKGARVREGDLVRIQGSPADLAILEELAVQTRKLGAHPLLTIQSDRLERRFYEEVPAKFDTQPPAFELKLAGLIDVQLGMESREEDALAGIPAERLVAVNQAAEAVGPTLLRRNVRTVWLGNRLYPSAARAKRYGITEAELTRLFRAGLAADGAEIHITGARLKKTLEAGNKLHLTGPGGTDLTLTITKRPVMISDGVLTPEREKKGGAACISWLPAGELFLTPVAGSAEGTVLAEHTLWLGKPIKNLKLTFKAGKLVSLTAESGAEALRAAYDKQGPGKEQFGAIDFGINPNVVLPAGSKVQTYIAAGMVTVALGNNSWAGGDNTINFGLDCHLPGCTVTVDDAVVVEGGKLR
jgi:leucyl aminopeptidase (aminopeptidase T)